ncbi:class I SAM-dependent methyltransferase [Shewanella canadensis]|uniref:class I SAM-dependent methyltransferase n=1 Tax=Shewanella canadensis TaxID=271096 RepID=UPI00163B07C4|nr:class I SAM-dependent methyltransferase [Shewanella canadensis]
MTNEFYNDNASLLARQYLSTSFEEVHASWLPHLNQLFDHHVSGLSILDVGAGIGRDAAYLAQHCSSQHTPAEQKVDVVAVEPAHILADLGKKYTKGQNVTWIVDSLPRLNRLTIYQNGFNLILLSAVWMHIPPNERCVALQTLENLLAPHGKLVISLRHGPNNDTRVMHPVSVDELQTIAKRAHLTVVDSSDRDTDKLGRTQVFWETVVLQRANDPVANPIANSQVESAPPVNGSPE